jgi:tetratricopeptide (TPR) repeat protein
MLSAIESFERSIAQDPSYAPAYAGLAMTYGLFTGYGHPGLDGYELYGRGMEMANRAIELDEDAAEGYAARGYLENRALAAAEPVETDFQRALELSPNSADVHGWYGHLLTRERRYDEGLAESEIGIQLDPLAPGRWVGQALDAIAARRYDLAARGAQQALALEPSLTSPRFYQGISHLLARRIDDCLNVLEGTFPGVQAMCQHSRGDEAGAMQTIDSLKTTLNSATDPQSHTEMMVYRDIAMFYAWIGNADESLTWLERAFSWSHDAVGSELIDSGIFDRVSEDPNFQSGLQRMQARIRERLRQVLAR